VQGKITLGIRVRHCEMDRTFPVGLPTWSEFFPLTSKFRVVPHRDPSPAEGFRRENKKRGKKKAFHDPRELRTRVARVFVDSIQIEIAGR